MTFSRANPSGWSTGNQLTPAQINALDLDHSRAVDGYAGGVFTPSAAIGLQGTGGFYGNVKTGRTVTIENGAVLSGASGCTILLGDIINLGAATYTRSFFLVPSYGGAADGKYNFDVTSSYGAALYWEQGAGPGAGDHFQINLENISRRAVIQTVTVYGKGYGTGANHAGQPTTLPAMQFGRLAPTTGLITSIASTTCPWVDVATYEAAWNFQLTGLATALYTDNGYVISFKGESGTNALAGLEVHCFKVTADFTAIECG